LSYLVLARTSRPQNFAQVLGQQSIVRTLQNALRRNRVAHALIFSGVRGTGKTTLARVMAKALNCEAGEAAEPCCACRSCKEIAAGIAVDLHEIDGASNRGIQEIRDLKENIRFMPVNARFKIILIDEVHMLTTEAFNALLKTLEEPPSHVYFMFATTELHKVPITILSRCQRYELKRVGRQELVAHFAALAAGEGIEIDQAALNMVAKEAGGSVRDGLSLLDQLFSYCGDKVLAEDVAEVLGLISHEVIAGTAQALLQGNLSQALDFLEQVYTHGMDVKRFMNELLRWFRNLVICAMSKNPGPLLELSAEEMALLQTCAAAHSPQTLFLHFHLLMEGLEKAAQPWTLSPRFAVEMAFIRAIQAEEVVPVNTLLGRLDQILAGLSPADGPLPEKKKTLSPSPQAQPASVEVPPAPGPEQKKSPAPAKEGGVQDIRKQWPEFILYVKERQPWLAALLQQAAAVRRIDGRLHIRYHDPTECSLLRNKEKRDDLTAFALDFFQEDLEIVLQVPQLAQQEGEVTGAALVQQERQSLRTEALVLAAVEIFNGQVGDVRVGPQFKKTLAALEEDSDTDELTQ
jgi:DNA polymerase-3 subunit gamma/tau